MSIRSRSAGCRTIWPWGSVLRSWRRLWPNAGLLWKRWATCKFCNYASKSSTTLSITCEINKFDRVMKGNQAAQKLTVQDRPSLFYLSSVTLECVKVTHGQAGSNIRSWLQCFHLIAFCGCPENDVMRNANWKTWRRTAVLHWVAKKALRRRYCITGEMYRSIVEFTQYRAQTNSAEIIIIIPISC